MGLFDSIRGGWRALKEAHRIDLYKQLSEREEEKAKLLSQIADLNRANKGLESRLAVKARLRFKHSVYWSVNKDEEIIDGPFCSRCYDSEEKLIRLISCPDIKYSNCPICNITLPIKEGVPWQERNSEPESTPEDDIF